MEVILRRAVENLGHPGDLVKVSAGYARNFLLPRGYAFEATPGNRKRIERERERLEAAEATRRQDAQTLADRLAEVSLTFSARVGDEGKLFGSVTAADIAEAVRAQAGVGVDRRDVHLSEPIRSVGTHEVRVKLFHEVEPILTVEVVAQA